MRYRKVPHYPLITISTMAIATHALGIDFHKAQSTLVLIDGKSAVRWKRRIRSTPEDFRNALDRLASVIPLAALPAVIEPVCGWRWAVAALKGAGIDVEVANPRRVRMIADSLDKTDENDAMRLAWIRMVGKLPTSYVASDEIVALRRLVRGYLSLVRSRTKLKNRIQALATEEGLNVVIGNAATTKGLKLLEKERGDDLAYRSLIDMLRRTDEAIRPLFLRMAELAKTHPVIKRLATMPNVGPVTGAVVYAEVGDFARFRSGKEIGSFAGLVPRERSSGERIRQGPITKTGSRILRHVLVEAATRVRKNQEDALSVYYTELSLRRADAKPKMLRIALARRMLVAMQRMVVMQSDFDPGRFVRNGG